LLKEKDTL